MMGLPGEGNVLAAMAAMRRMAQEGSRRYPEWRSKRKTKGARDRSKKQRSNRRKAAARARR